MKTRIIRFYHLASQFRRTLRKLTRPGLSERNPRGWFILKRRAERLLFALRRLRLTGPVAAAGTLAGAGMILPLTTSAQFVQVTGTQNPFNGVDVGLFSAPCFVKLDGDGDFDACVGDMYGMLHYYKNTGTVTAPVMTEQFGSANPMNTIDAGWNAMPAFTDIDNDGDYDLFIGRSDGDILYYKNTGNSSSPVFTQQTGAANPLSSVNVGQYSAPAFTDIDGDGDKDVFIGSSLGSIYYYRNTGTPGSPVFTEQTGSANPLNGVNPGYCSAPALVDIDGDLDYDCFIGMDAGTVVYYKNSGTASSPQFVLQTGSANPLAGVTTGGYSTPAFADIDGDSDRDFFTGEFPGTVLFFRNTSGIGIPATLSLTNLTVNGTSCFNATQTITAGGNGTIFKVVSGGNATLIAGQNIRFLPGSSVVPGGSLIARIAPSGPWCPAALKESVGPSALYARTTGPETVLYPNPTDGIVRIRSGTVRTPSDMKAEVTDIKGKKMPVPRKDTETEIVLSLAGLPAGVYLVRLTSGSETTLKKLVLTD